MIDFKTINLTDKEWVDKLLKISDFRGCEYTFANNLAWHRLNDTKVAKVGDFYMNACVDSDTLYVTYPAGRGNIKSLVALLKEYSEELNKKLLITGVTRDTLDLLISVFGGENVSFELDRDNSDYIYRSTDLIELRGKKYHGKRNHIARFKDSGDWRFVPITDKNTADCFEFAANSYNRKNDYDDRSAVAEQFAINVFLTNYNALGLVGGILYRDGKMAGFAIGERLNSDTLVEHIEKADPDIPGAYPCLCNEFAKAYAADFKYINREEDMGIQGLRFSKKSYQPCFLLEKYAVRIDTQRKEGKV